MFFLWLDCIEIEKKNDVSFKNIWFIIVIEIGMDNWGIYNLERGILIKSE